MPDVRNHTRHQTRATRQSMKLLFDQNLSHRLPDRIQDLYPGSQHSRLVLSQSARDEDIWEYASTHDFVIVSKDVNFGELSRDRGHPPKVIRLTIGNCTVNQVESLLRRYENDIRIFNDSDAQGLMQLS